MPNHITNRLTIIGTNEQVAEIKNFLKIEKETEQLDTYDNTIDFNKITPMPKWVFNGNLGREQEEKYGKENCWYEWCRENWGTKWNAYSQPDSRGTDNVIYFTTAWSCPVELMQKLSWIFPEVEFEIAWADEDFGYNIGSVRFKDGEILNEYAPKGGTFEARTFFFKVTKADPHEYEEYFEDYGEKVEDYVQALQETPTEEPKEDGIIETKTGRKLFIIK